jgi:hypothetical protein
MPASNEWMRNPGTDRAPSFGIDQECHEASDFPLCRCWRNFGVLFDTESGKEGEDHVGQHVIAIASSSPVLRLPELLFIPWMAPKARSNCHLDL